MQKIIVQRSVEIILAVILVVFFLVSSIPAAEHYELVTEWGGEGSGAGQFGFPAGIAIDSEDNIYVTDTGNDCIQKFTSEGEFITKWGSEGTGDGEFNRPEDVAVDKEGNLYVVDLHNHRIQKFTSEGEFITKWGSEGTGDGEFYYPRSVDTDSGGNVYVADAMIEEVTLLISSRIQKFTSEGEFVRQWGFSDVYMLGADFLAWGLATDNEDKVYVLDPIHSQIQIFNSDGELITKWIYLIVGDFFVAPSAIAIDSEKNVYMTGGGNGNVTKFTSNGEFITRWEASPVKGKFGMPPFLWGIDIDSAGCVYVIEIMNAVVQKYAKNGQPCSIEKLYGEYSEETELLRNFRDNILSQTSEGQEIIRLYYQWSPAIVKAMEEDEEFKEGVKEMIDGVLELIEGTE